jgi:hypothetical protein
MGRLLLTTAIVIPLSLVLGYHWWIAGAIISLLYLVMIIVITNSSQLESLRREQRIIAEGELGLSAWLSISAFVAVMWNRFISTEHSAVSYLATVGLSCIGVITLFWIPYLWSHGYFERFAKRALRKLGVRPQ